MKTEFITLNPRNTEPPIYMSRTQFEDAYDIPDEYKKRIVIVDFKEEEDDARTEDTESK